MKKNPHPELPGSKLTRLSDLPTGCSAMVAGTEGRAADLMELGFVPGARVTPTYRAVHGDPRVYDLDGMLVALRRSTAERISVRLRDEAGEEGH